MTLTIAIAFEQERSDLAVRANAAYLEYRRALRVQAIARIRYHAVKDAKTLSAYHDAMLACTAAMERSQTLNREEQQMGL